MHTIQLTLIYLMTIYSCVQGLQKNTYSSNYEDQILRKKYGPVIFANMLYRHGDRTIRKNYPNDPYKDSLLWKIGHGQLTQEGKLRQFRLGQWIRANYPTLVGDEYSYDNIFVTSSYVARCLMSAQCNLAGMYPAKNGSVIPFQPVPIHTTPAYQDNMIKMSAQCPKFDLARGKIATSRYMMDLNNQLKDLYTDLATYTGLESVGLEEIYLIYDTLKIEHEQFNLILPEWAASVFPDPLQDISLTVVLSHTHTDTMKRLRGGPLLTDMLSHLVSKANSTLNPDRKLWMYSGHEETIVALLHALDLHHPPITIPSYASLFVMELRKLKEKYFVTMMYKEGTNESGIELRPAVCGDKACTLDRFVQLTRNMIVNNWKQECALPQHNAIFSKDSTKPGILTWIFMAIILICILRAFIFKSQRKPPTPSKIY